MCILVKNQVIVPRKRSYDKTKEQFTNPNLLNNLKNMAVSFTKQQIVERRHPFNRHCWLSPDDVLKKQSSLVQEAITECSLAHANKNFKQTNRLLHAFYI